MKSLRPLMFLLCALGGALLVGVSPAQDSGSARLADKPVTLFSARWCPYCTQARHYLAGNRIAYREIDIESSEGRFAFEEIGGTGKGVPLLIAGDRQIRGFSTTTYDSVFAAR